MKGTLQDFRVAEILQLVAVQQKTGMLRVQGMSTTLTFYFERGMLVSCRDRRRLVVDPLLDYMRRTGWLDPSIARQLESELTSPRSDLAELLLARHLVSTKELASILLDLAQELITASYSWNEGSYLFVAGDEALLGLNHRMSRNIEGLLMEAARRADEWPRLLQKIPGPETIVGGLESVPQGLDATTRSILEKLAQPISMHELATHAKIPEFEVYETIAQALESNIAKIIDVPRQATVPRGVRTASAEVADAPEDEVSDLSDIPAVRAPRRFALGAHAARALTWFVAIMVCTACLAGAIFLTEHRLDQQTNPSDTQLESARVRVERDLEIHRAVFGKYPTSLEELVSSDLTPAPTLEQAAVTSFRRISGGSSYRIEYASTEGP